MTTLMGLDLTGRTVLLAGGGPVAARRVAPLLADGARIRLVAPELCEDLRDLTRVRSDLVRWYPREVTEQDLHGVWLVVAATGSRLANRQLAGWALQRTVFCVHGGAAHQGTARAPATTRSGDLLVGVVTDVARGASADPRRVAAVREQIGELLRSGADQRHRRPATRNRPGKVTLVGGGPGAVDLLTLAGRRALAEADVVVTDRLGPTGVLAELAEEVEVIRVGKEPGHHPVPQLEINAILVDRARRGRQVVRLKGGDPFVFGRGGEEVIACREAGIEVAVVPGISSALAVPALAGVPATHRGVVGAVHIATGHDGLDPAARTALVEGCATVVILMGIGKVAAIVAQAVATGADPLTPAAVIERGSTPEQRVLRSHLAALPEAITAGGFAAPAVIVIGAVADEKLLAA